MRAILLGLAALAVAAGHPVQAADLAAPVPAPDYHPPVQPLSIVSELRIGGSVQDPWSPESGSGNVTGEVLLAKPTLTPDPFWNQFIPRPTVGGSYNTAGRTSYAYLGATWTFDITERFFVEGFFGASFHNGATGRFVPPGFNALGCSPLFREAGSVGFRITEHWSVLATIEHQSNAGLCVANRGLTNVGGKIAYTF
ncbi:acyloxyacyl hydrolase [Methylobacterium nodulans]|nr:acyloxyacyl hydrolase [Methylobacterium nodulans]